jgi:type II secretory pathway pseudopilin PulG
VAKPGRTRGFTYLGIIFVIGLMGVLLASTGTIWSQSAQREKEKELIHVGNQFQRAIGRYYERSPGTVKRYPQSIEDLLYDKRYLSTQRYLRRMHTDPMTGKPEWGYVRAPDGGIMGVYSTSQAEPIKFANFRVGNERFAQAKRYAEWQFVYVPVAPAALATKAAAGK